MFGKRGMGKVRQDQKGLGLQLLKDCVHLLAELVGYCGENGGGATGNPTRVKLFPASQLSPATSLDVWPALPP